MSFCFAKRADAIRFFVLALLGWWQATQPATAATILVYHRFGAVVSDSMTVTTPVFEAQLAWLKVQGYRFVRLRALVEELEQGSPPLEPMDVAITADDGHRSVFTDMFPIIKRDKIPVTLFIYPSAISNASYAMTWPQLAEMVRSGLVDVQSHTYWHPNFKTEAARLDATAYDKFVRMQLSRSKETLTAHLGVSVDMLAWPFGIYDPDLERKARDAGYIAGFTLNRRHIHSDDDLLALPRYLMSDLDRGARFGAIFESQGPLR